MWKKLAATFWGSLLSLELLVPVLQPWGSHPTMPNEVLALPRDVWRRAEQGAVKPGGLGSNTVFFAFPFTSALVTVFLTVENNQCIPIKFLRGLNFISRLEIPYSIWQKLRAAVLPALSCHLWGAAHCLYSTDALLVSSCSCC